MFGFYDCIGSCSDGVLTEGIFRINERLRKAGESIISPGELDLDKMPFVYAAADLMLFTSYHETFGLAPLEAAASGMPVIYRDLEVYKLLYKNPYLKARDNNEFINLTKRMIHDKDFYNEGLKISEQLIKQFDKNDIRGKLISLYETLIGN